MKVIERNADIEPTACLRPGHDLGCGCHRVEAVMAPYAARLIENRRRFLLRAAAGGLSILTFSAFAEEAEADMFKPSVAEQKKLGAQAAADTLKKYPEVKDERARRFRRIGEKLVDSLDRKDRNWNYNFRVLNSKEVNAFALPGGPMFLFTGLYDRIKSDDELAAVTGHEMTHVRKEHWANSVAAQTKRELGLTVILGLTRANGSWRQIAGVGESLYTLKFSRGDEYAADDGGFANMRDAGFDPHGMIDLFNTLTKAGDNGGVEFLQTHPLTKERIGRVQHRLDSMKKDSSKNSGE